MSNLRRLENIGIPVLTSDYINIKSIKSALKLLPLRIQWDERGMLRYNKDTPPTTWRDFHDTLRGLGCEELSQLIEDYLSSKLDNSDVVKGI